MGRMATVLRVLYDDPVAGYPPVYARDEVRTGSDEAARFKSG
jgi:hypothetical protein